MEAMTPQRGVYHDDAVPDSAPGGDVSREEKLSLAKAAKDDQERLDRVLSAVADDGLLLGDDLIVEALGAPVAPADRRLRETTAAKQLWHSLWFTPDAQAVVFAGQDDKELAVWSLGTGERTVAVTRSGGIAASALSPDGRWLCVATMDGLAMYSYPPPCELKWEAQSGTPFCAVAFSRDGCVVASVRGGDTWMVEVCHAETNKLLRAIDDFSACCSHGGARPGGLGFSCELLAVGGKDGKPNGKQVRLYSVASDVEEVATLELPGTNEARCCFALEFSPAGDRLAVAICDVGDTLVAVFSGENGWQDPPLQLSIPVAGDKRALSVCFSNGGRFMCSRKRFLELRDLGPRRGGVRACVRIIQGPGTNGGACAFSPALDLLVTGGGTGTCMIHELLPQVPVTTLRMPGGEDDTPLVAACASAEVAVLARGTCVAAVWVADGKVLRQVDVEGLNKNHYIKLALQPTGDQAAVFMESIQAVPLRDMHDNGREIKHLAPSDGQLMGVNYSSDGSLVFVCVRSAPRPTRLRRASCCARWWTRRGHSSSTAPPTRPVSSSSSLAWQALRSSTTWRAARVCTRWTTRRTYPA